MQLVIEVPFIGGDAKSTWSLRHSAAFLAVLYGLVSQWAFLLVLVTVGLGIAALLHQIWPRNEQNAPRNAVPTKEAPPEAVSLVGSKTKIAGTTRGYGKDPKRLYYTLHVAPCRGQAWTIDRSYKEFRALYKALVAAYAPNQEASTPSLTAIKFPKRAPGLLINRAKRTQGLATFVEFLVANETLSNDAMVVEFLGVNSPDKRMQEDAPLLPAVINVTPVHQQAEQKALSTLTDDQRVIVKQTSSEVPSDLLYGRAIVLQRYLSTMQWQVNEAKTSILRAIEWRQQNLPKFDRAVLQNEFQTGKMYVSDFLDAQQNAVIIVRLHLENSFPQSNYLVNAMYTMERALLHTSPVHHCNIVIDFSTYAFKHGPEQGIFFKFVKMMEAQYLHHVNRVILFDFPWYMNQGFNMMKPFFDPVTRSKFVSAKSSDTSEIQDFINPNALLKHVGKGATYPFNVDEYLDSVGRINSYD